jgi:mono/diheme cytochrome c family protein
VLPASYRSDSLAFGYDHFQETWEFHMFMTRKLGFRTLAIAALCSAAASVGAEELSAYSGSQLFQRFCASCHGKAAEGDGPVAASFKTLVPDLTTLAKRRGNQFPKDLVRRVIDGREIKLPHGTRDMPVWGREFAEAQGADVKAQQEAAAMIDRLVAYVESVQRKP